LQKQGISYESDLKPALGPEVGVSGLGLNGSYVLFTKSPKPDQLEALLKKGKDPVVTRQVDGWVVASDKAAALDLFVQARGNGSLADTSAFKDAISKVQTDGLALAYAPGSTIDTGATKVAQGQPLSSAQITNALGKVQSLAASARPRTRASRFDITGSVDNGPSTSSFEPTLDQTLPAKRSSSSMSTASARRYARRWTRTSSRTRASPSSAPRSRRRSA